MTRIVATRTIPARENNGQGRINRTGASQVCPFNPIVSVVICRDEDNSRKGFETKSETRTITIQVSLFIFPRLLLSLDKRLKPPQRPCQAALRRRLKPAWAGSAFVLARFIEPAAAATLPESNKFMQQMMGAGGYVIVQAIAGPLTVLAGLILYWIDSSGSQKRNPIRRQMERDSPGGHRRRAYGDHAGALDLRKNWAAALLVRSEKRNRQTSALRFFAERTCY